MTATIKLFNYSRTSTLILLHNIADEEWDVQPEGYPNTIRWNAGHVYATAEDYLSDADSEYTITHPEWNDFFLDGTRPSEWPDHVPSAKEIITALEKQKERIAAHFQNKLQDKATNIRDINGTKLDTMDAALQFVTWHEGIHLGSTKTLRLAVQK